MHPVGRLSPGQRFGAYLIEACVGVGGMGAVYRATDTKLGRTVALKIMRNSPEEGPTAEAIARFLRESRVGASLTHPNIAVVFESGAVDDCPYLAMEWVDGASLAMMMSRGAGALPPAQRLDILDALADALAHAHARGVVHRDVKPTNVMIDSRGRAKLVDFGIAKRTTALAAGTQMLPTHARSLLGTPAYMAPEQMLSPSVDARADQFSWAVMAYELLSGSHPNETVPPDGPPFPVAKAKPLGWVQPDVPDAIAAIIHRAMSYEPGARFGSMDEISHAWRAARGVGPSAPYGSTPPPQGAPYGSNPYAAHAAATTIGTGNATVQTSMPPMAAISNAPPAMMAARAPAPKSFPWIAIVVAGVALVVLSGAGLALVLTGNAPAALPGGAPLPISLGPKTAFIEPIDRVKFSAPPAEVAKAKAALEAKLTPCLDGSVSKEQSFRATVLLAGDGRITKVTELNVCKEQHPSFYLCTERQQKPPKRGFPTVPDSVFACLDRALVSSRLPKVALDPGETTAETDLHVEVR